MAIRGLSAKGLSAALLALGATPAWAGPFGLEAGTPLSRMSTIFEKEPGIYEIEVPQPHPHLPIYSALISPTKGLCAVVASGLPLSDDGHGTRVRGLIEEIAAPLAVKYGAGTKRDSLKASSAWKEPRHWAMGIAKGERTYALHWNTPSDPEISTIELSANAVRSGGATYVELNYRFKGPGACADKIKAAKGSAR